MTVPFSTDIYRGQGQTLAERGENLPEPVPFSSLEDPADYMASSDLRDAVHVALALGQPLLLTGEPGTGKTRLAASLAWELGLEYLEFHTKTASTAPDLFYHYDAMRRFQDIQIGQIRSPEEYLRLRALGKAILLTLEKQHPGRELLPEELRGKEALRSVVLIDEIDKAPRDLPNDVLDEVERMRFRIPEIPHLPEFRARPQLQPILILTSNSEKNLPEAFLRRCVFYHIPFPDMESLKAIVKKRFDGQHTDFSEDFLNRALEIFLSVRKRNLRKKPATAEFLSWISLLAAGKIDPAAKDEKSRRWMKAAWSVLAKTPEDLALLREKE